MINPPYELLWGGGGGGTKLNTQDFDKFQHLKFAVASHI